MDPHKLSAMRSWWGRSTSGIVVVCALALWQPVASTAASCTGRTQLSCSEKTALYYDAVNWAVGGFGSLDLFAAPKTLHLNNPALSQFWRYEAATGMTRYVFELGIGSPGNDGAYESVVTAAKLPAPVIKPSGIVHRHTASVMSLLLAAEQQEIVNLVGADVALNRAFAATVAGRQDWANYQTYTAALLLRRAAAAIGQVIPRQHALSKALLGAGLRFGVGPADQHAEQRYVRRHGFPAPLKQIMTTLGNNAVTLAFIKSAFVHAKPSAKTFSMTGYLSSASVMGDEKKCARALVSFANSVPSVPRPS
jgi:hypothetical protein